MATQQTDAIRSYANQLIATANEQDQLAAAGWPLAADCLAGTVPTMPGMLGSTSTNPYWVSRRAYFQRMHANVKPGSILFLGDSLTDAMALNDVTPFGVNMAIGGETTRQLVNRINEGGTANAIHKASAVFILIGVNDYQHEIAVGATPSQAVENTLFMWQTKLLPWLTGKLVVCKLLPVDDSLVQGTSNSVINQINSGLSSLIAGRANTAVVDVSAQLAPSGQLLSQYHIGDGLHLSGAGYAILKPAIANALQSLGV